MKLILYFIILFICNPIFVFSMGYNPDREMAENEIISDHDYIQYEFGMSESSTILVIKDRDHYVVLIKCSKSGDVTKKINITGGSILEWAFDSMPKELSEVEYVMDSSYRTVYYKLSYNGKKGTDRVEIPSTYLISDKGLREKLDELKAYLIQIWISNWLIDDI